MPDSNNAPARKVPNIPMEAEGMAKHHARNVNGTLEEIAVYEVATGRKLVTTFIDAREAVANGSCTWTPPGESPGEE